MKIIGKIFRFLKYTRYKGLAFQVLIYSAIFRLKIKYVSPDKLHKQWGVEGEESPYEETKENYQYAGKVAYTVDRICNRTTWESKCLVRALTAQKLLKKKKIASTLYLGCGLEEGKMIAHAWLRCGIVYVTGGTGEGYSIVDKFRA